MTKFKNLKVGGILSEIQFYTIEKIKGDQIQLINDQGIKIILDDQYVESCLNSADLFESEEKKTMTELAELFINSPRIAMTVAFYKKDTNKTKKVFDAEKQAKIDAIQSARVADVPKLLNDLIENPLSKVIPGELRIMKGRHYSEIDELGRIKFTDMEIPKTTAESRLRQVDPRTILFLIVNNIKYSLK